MLGNFTEDQHQNQELAGVIFSFLPFVIFCQHQRRAKLQERGLGDLQGEMRESMLNEFKAFIARGNVMDLAVGVIIGGAFGKIVSSLVDDIIMPVVGAITGGVDFSNYFIPLNSAVTAVTLAEAKKQGAVFAYGSFITVAINFLILAWIIFLMVKAVNRMQKKEEAKPEVPAAPPADIVLLTEIRDLLQKQA